MKTVTAFIEGCVSGMWQTSNGCEEGGEGNSGRIFITLGKPSDIDKAAWIIGH